MSLQRFSADERRRLLTTPGIGEVVLHRLEAAGFGSLQALRQAGAQHVTECVRLQLGEAGWRNRRRAIARAIDATLPAPGTSPEATTGARP
jgi:hypothetical protein